MSSPYPHTGLLTDGQAVAEAFQRLARRGLEEDLGFGPDATTLTTVAADTQATADVVAREGGVISGIDAMITVADVARDFAADLGGQIHVAATADNGKKIGAGEVVATVSGDLRALLQLERTMLNVISHASGIATQTSAWVDKVRTAGAPDCAIRDSRKTLPGLRMLQKRAVLHGGGTPHRWGLGDQAMIKDNHVLNAGLLPAIVQIRAAHPDLWLEVEVDDLEQLRDVLGVTPQQVLLDNFTPADTKQAVALRDALSPTTLLESSGGLTIDVAGDYAACGVDSLAVGALTHSVTVLDLGLDLRH